MSTSTVTAETVFQNLSAMYDQFTTIDDPLECPPACAHCGIDEVYGRFGADALCERCDTLIGNILTNIRYGLEPDENGSVSVVP